MRAEHLSAVPLLTGVLFLFWYLNSLHPYLYIDEAFHVPQVRRYCAGNLTEWDPKITTLPGLYLVTSALLSPLNLCSLSFIRFTNVLGTFANLYLAYAIVDNLANDDLEKWNGLRKLAVACNVAFLPPLFFWFFLYYTDVLSVCTVLLMLLLHLRKSFRLAACVGVLSILMRQTNVVWLGFLTVERAVDLLETGLPEHDPKERQGLVSHLKLLWHRIKSEASNGPLPFSRFAISLTKDLLPYATVCALFLLFVAWNGGIVVGDRTAHVPTFHLPQVLYFSLFAFAFSWPHAIAHWRGYFRFLEERRTLSAIVLAILTIVVHTNTLVHPYVLADNRHYVFYIWNRFMLRRPLFRYLLVPFYTFAIYTCHCCIRHQRASSRFSYILVVGAVLVPQLLLEPRYFIVPYLFYRLAIKGRPRTWQILAESVTTIIVNCVQFYVFARKTFYWEDQKDPQRISW